MLKNSIRALYILKALCSAMVTLLFIYNAWLLAKEHDPLAFTILIIVSLCIFICTVDIAQIFENWNKYV